MTSLSNAESDMKKMTLYKVLGQFRVKKLYLSPVKNRQSPGLGQQVYGSVVVLGFSSLFLVQGSSPFTILCSTVFISLTRAGDTASGTFLKSYL